MGGAATAATGLANPSTRLFVTPPGEIELCCRLALASRLHALAPDDVMAFILGEPAARGAVEPAARRQWEAVLSTLQEVAVIDPACGEGDFLLGALSLLDELEAYLLARLGRSHDSRRTRLRIGTCQLYGVEVRGERLVTARRRLREQSGGTPMLVHDDSLVPAPDFSWEALRPGGFDLVIGNPPYVRHERIADPRNRRSQREYSAALVQGLRNRLPQVLGSSPRGTGGLPDGRSDLSALFLYLGLSLVRPEGALAFVLPSALFQARYGGTVLQALQTGNRVVALAESPTHRSFAGAGVNTGIVLAGARGTGPPAVPLRRVELHGRPGKEAAGQVWRAALRPRTDVRPIPGDRHLVPLSDLGRLRYPVKTGLNRFFYPDAGTIATFGIEPEYCCPALKSPRQVDRLLFGPSDISTRAFVCTDNPETLQPGVARYVEWGSRQRTAHGIPWPHVPSVRGRKHWYMLPVPAPADVICPRFFDRRLFFVLPEASILEDQTFYGLILAPDQVERRDLVGALLTCSLTCLMLETHGRTGLGDGVRQYALGDFIGLRVPDPRAVPDWLVDPILRAFRVVAGRRILPIDEEMRQDDRRALDEFAGEALGCSARSMERVRRELIGRVRQRIDRAASPPQPAVT